MIAYKVVDKETRYGSNYAIAKYGYAIAKYGYLPLPEDIWRRFENFVNKYPKFFPRYLPGSKILAVPKSPGLMAFEELEYARSFTNSYRVENKTIIVKVKGRKRQKISRIFGGCAGEKVNLLLLIGTKEEKEALEHNWGHLPSGTLFFNSLTVLE